jgi:hypothetical protein
MLRYLRAFKSNLELLLKETLPLKVTNPVMIFVIVSGAVRN